MVEISKLSFLHVNWIRRYRNTRTHIKRVSIIFRSGFWFIVPSLLRLNTNSSLSELMLNCMETKFYNLIHFNVPGIVNSIAHH